MIGLWPFVPAILLWALKRGSAGSRARSIPPGESRPPGQSQRPAGGSRPPAGRSPRPAGRQSAPSKPSKGDQLPDPIKEILDAAAPPAPAPSKKGKASSSRTVALKPGTTYRALLKLTGAAVLATNDMVVERIQQTAGPFADAKGTGAGADRVVTGRYAGKARTVKLPPEVLTFSAIGSGSSSSSAPRTKPKPAPRKPTPAARPPSPLDSGTVARRSPQAAATDLLAYVNQAVKAKKTATLGSKGKPNTFVEAAQRDMGGLTADGIYGPDTRARGKALTGKSFPPR